MTINQSKISSFVEGLWSLLKNLRPRKVASGISDRIELEQRRLEAQSMHPARMSGGIYILRASFSRTNRSNNGFSQEVHPRAKRVQEHTIVTTTVTVGCSRYVRMRQSESSALDRR